MGAFEAASALRFLRLFAAKLPWVGIGANPPILWVLKERRLPAAGGRQDGAPPAEPRRTEVRGRREGGNGKKGKRQKEETGREGDYGRTRDVGDGAGETAKR